ncbi:synaptotagmin-4-like isoform X1 [Tachypleus tridentatus]|uniref:synaptotagmin-4-like isoform X1 n=2 Tax=Tachypleus tridentatus TaxID=6853 RepID=UPI003FD00663
MTTKMWKVSDWTQILFVVMSAVFGFFAVSFVLLCWRFYILKKQKQRSADIQDSYNVLLKSRGIPKTIAVNQSMYADDPFLMRKLPPQPSFLHLEHLKTRDNSDSSFSDTDCETENQNVKAGLPHSSADNLDRLREDAGDTLTCEQISIKKAPLIEFSLIYEPSKKSLTVQIIRVTNLPLKYRKICFSFVKVFLLGHTKISRSTSVSQKSLNPEFKENLTFEYFSLEELRQFMLRLSVYIKYSHLVKNRRIGDFWLNLSKLELTPNIRKELSEEILLLKTSRTTHSVADLGFLFISLQYQPEANRLKVMVRKANNLRRQTVVSITQSEYYVIINLLRGVESITCKETKPVSGPNPVWNQPFIFDIPKEFVHQYSLQFLLMRDRIYSRDGVVGQVLVGQGSTSLGTTHWNEAMAPGAVETTKWHDIIQVDKY